MAFAGGKLWVTNYCAPAELEAVVAESAMEEVELGGAAIADEISGRVAEPIQLPPTEPPHVGEDASHLAPLVADPLQRKEDQVLMPAPRGPEQHPSRLASAPAECEQLWAGPFDAPGRRALETSPEPGQLQSLSNRLPALRSMSLKELIELESQLNEPSFLGIEMRR